MKNTVHNQNVLKIWILAVLSLTGPWYVFAQGNELDADSYEDIADWDHVSEIMRHLYRWYFDDFDLRAFPEEDVFECHIMPLELELDAEDRSQFAEVYLPAFETIARLKKTDYEVEELDLKVASSSFKIVNVERVEGDYPLTEGTISRQFTLREMRNYLFSTRHQQDPPSPELLERLRLAVESQWEQQEFEVARTSSQTVFVSPISPVANEIWAYWQDAQVLIRWKSDIDITRPEVWEHERLITEIIDIEEQVVLSFSMVPGSNAYLNRDQVGRVLYNCTVFGQKLTVNP